MIPALSLDGGAKVKRRKTAGKIVGSVLLSWWIFLLIVIGLAGNAFLVFKALKAGNVAAGVLFVAFFCVAYLFIFSTTSARAGIRGRFFAVSRVPPCPPHRPP